jgi:hypothetical protein
MKDKNIYIIAYYYKKPKNHVNTSVKGWMDNPDNVRWDEKVGITRGISKRDIQAHVIVNLSEKRVERNNLNGNKDFEMIFKYFFSGYSKYITEVMSKLDPAYLEHMVNVWETDLAANPEAGEIIDVPAQVISETVSTK